MLIKDVGGSLSQAMRRDAVASLSTGPNILNITIIDAKYQLVLYVLEVSMLDASNDYTHEYPGSYNNKF